MSAEPNSGSLTRRQFVAAGALGTAVAAIGCRNTRLSGYEFLSDSQARTLAVICDEIIPADDYPSASQAGVLDFIDRQLVRHNRRHQQSYLSALAKADALSRGICGSGLADAPPDRQHDVVVALEQQATDFFELIRNHTMEGFYGSPRHGGNRDAVSWRMLGLPDPPPLGRAQYDLTQGPVK